MDKLKETSRTSSDQVLHFMPENTLVHGPHLQGISDLVSIRKAMDMRLESGLLAGQKIPLSGLQIEMIRLSPQMLLWNSQHKAGCFFGLRTAWKKSSLRI
ncbi:hypothetical protein PVK06_010647 [Gossypium arboreum]|uniref:Uncharacterized protein n=1 Tax=Gossypium arboreum TaxID=29729 RepID=A0ABR0Q754_GOSAR|nr:hypothetical protein PVK06_010647 [Gossypium arboreum]